MAGVFSQGVPEPGEIIFGRLAALWREDYVEKVAADKPMIAKPTQEVYINALEKHIFPKWKDARHAELPSKGRPPVAAAGSGFVIHDAQLRAEVETAWCPSGSHDLFDYVPVNLRKPLFAPLVQVAERVLI